MIYLTDGYLCFFFNCRNKSIKEEESMHAVIGWTWELYGFVQSCKNVFAFFKPKPANVQHIHPLKKLPYSYQYFL